MSQLYLFFIFRFADIGKEQDSGDLARESNSNNSANASGNSNNTDRQIKRARRTRMDSLVEPTHAIDLMVQAESRASSLASNTNGNQKKNTVAAAGKKKKRKSRQGNQQNQHREDTPPQHEEDMTVDPNEPTYCLCDQISYGEMILCDNDLCPFEWFHFSCVQLMTKPKGKWYCPKCRGDRPNIMKPRARFMKVLEKYNKEKEEKSLQEN